MSGRCNDQGDLLLAGHPVKPLGLACIAFLGIEAPLCLVARTVQRRRGRLPIPHRRCIVTNMTGYMLFFHLPSDDMQRECHNSMTSTSGSRV